MASSEHTIAAAPFDYPGADLILRSADKVDFLVTRHIMSLASPIFADMFDLALPSAADTVPHGRDAPVIDLTEQSRTLDYLLRYIYPIDKPDIENAEHILDVSNAASKYMIDIVEEGLARRFAALAEEQPFQAYAQAYSHRREDAMRVAARASLAHPWPGAGHDLTIEFVEFPGALRRLKDYHSACGDAAATVIRTAGAISADPLEKPWFPYTHTSEWRNRPEPRFYYTAHPWWRDALETLVKIVRLTPHPRVTTTQRFFGILMAKAAQGVPGSNMCSVLLSFIDDYSARVDRAVSEVKLEIHFE